MKWLSNHDKVAFISGERRVSFTQLMGLVLKASEAMGKHSKREDRVAIIGANSPEWVIALYAIWHIHATCVPIDFMSTPDEIAYILDDCTPSAIWCDGGALEKVTQALSKMKNPQPEIMRLESLDEKALGETTGDFSTVGESDNDELALIIYTSGTTGSPKGVMLTFENLEANTDATSKQIKVFIPEDRLLVLLPLLQRALRPQSPLREPSV